MYNRLIYDMITHNCPRTLQAALENKEVIEYPVIRVVLPQDMEQYRLITEEEASVIAGNIKS